jgi:hypothetical protein
MKGTSKDGKPTSGTATLDFLPRMREALRTTAALERTDYKCGSGMALVAWRWMHPGSWLNVVQSSRLLDAGIVGSWPEPRHRRARLINYSALFASH